MLAGGADSGNLVHFYGKSFCYTFLVYQQSLPGECACSFLRADQLDAGEGGIELGKVIWGLFSN